MKNFFKFTVTFILVLYLLLTSVMAEEKQGQVTIPLDQFLKLMNSGSNKPATPSIPPPPVTLVFGTGDLSVTPLKDALKVQCKVIFKVFHGGWNEISLISNQAALSQVKIDGEEMAVYIKDGKYTVVYKGAGNHTLDMTYLVSTRRTGNTTSGKLLLPPSSSSNLTLIIPATGINIQVNPSMGGSTVEEEKKTIFKGTLPSAEGIDLSWSLRTVSDNSRQSTGKPRIYAQVYDLLSVSVGSIQITGLVNLSILRGQTDNFSFSVPEDVEILEIKSDKLQTWSVEEGKNNKKLLIFLTEKVEGTQQVTVIYEKPLKNVSSVWTAPFLQVIGAEQEKGFIACEAKTSLEMKSTEEQNINRVDVKELPSALVNLASSPVILAYRYYKHPFVLSIETQKHEELPVLSATIDTAQAVTFVNDDGLGLTKVIYQMKNNEKQFLELKLPEGSEILNAFVAGSPVKPVKASDSKDKRTVLIPLRKSETGENSGLSSFAVEITYKSKSGSFSFLGSKSEILPGCDVQISEYYWTIYLPEGNRVLSFTGNMKQAEGMMAPVNRNLFLNEAKYDKNIAEKIAPSAEMVDIKDKRQLQQTMVQNFTSTTVADNTGRVSGVLPVELYIPQSGQVFSFKKLLVEEGQTPSVIASYVGQSFVGTVCWFFLSLSFLLIIIPGKKGLNRNRLIPAGIVLLVSFLIGKKIGEIFFSSIVGIILGFIYLAIVCNLPGRILNFFKKLEWHKPVGAKYNNM
ncbi:MAG TPA: hypothetical protein PL110_09770 [Candidatus Eremiobacteraeota bacterium]|nr:MAG: hypothetical protein BWY64_00533 [bacterium ADurb.Bin363]HPZ08390.1 hypothetical protein [Candidatus Eremiobacteraeota bacterium]